MANTALTPGAITGVGYSYPTMQSQLPQQYVFNGDSSSSVSNGSGFNTGSLIGTALGWVHDDISSIINRQYNKKMLEKQNQWNEDMWNKTNEYNDPKNQVQRLINAGLNPLNYGLDGSSASSMQSAQALADNPSSVRGLANPIQSAIETGMKKNLQDAQIENIEAQTAKIKADTEGSQLSNDFARETFEARVEGERLSNSLKSKQIELIDKEKSKILEEIKKIKAETESEGAKKLLYEAEAGLAKARAWQIAQITPVEVALTKAKTEHEKAMGVLTTIQAMYQKDMISSGYVNSLVNEIQARTVGHLTNNDIKALENDIKHGDAGKIAKWFNDHEYMKAVLPAAAFLSTDLWSVLNQVSVASGGILGPILGFAVGKGVKSPAPAEVDASPWNSTPTTF